MNKSAIYATVKTSNLIAGVAAGIVDVEIGRAYGTGVAVACFIPLAALAIAWACFVDWILKKLDIPNY